MNITKNSIRNKFILKMYSKNVMWHILLIFVAFIFSMSLIFLPVGKKIRDTASTLRIYENGAVFSFSLDTRFNIIRSEDIEAEVSLYNKTMYELFRKGHSKEDYTIFTPFLGCYSPDLKGTYYDIRTAGPLNYKLKEGRCFAGDANEAIVYGDEFKVGDVITIDNTKVTIVGILDCIPPVGSIALDEEKDSGIVFMDSLFKTGNAIIVNYNSPLVQDGMEIDDYDVVFDLDKYTDEEIEKMRYYGYVHPVEEQTISVDSIYYKYIRIIQPILYGILLFLTIKCVLGKMKYKLLEDITLYHSHGMQDLDIIKLLSIPIFMDVLFAGIWAIEIMEWLIYTKKYIAINFFMIICSIIITSFIIKIYYNKFYYSEITQQELKLRRERYIAKELTVYENILLTAICITKNDSNARSITSNYLRIFWLENVRNCKTDEVEEKYIKRLKLALWIMKSKEDYIEVENLWEDDAEETENIKSMIKDIEFRNNVDVVIKELVQ